MMALAAALGVGGLVTDGITNWDGSAPAQASIGNWDGPSTDGDGAPAVWIKPPGEIVADSGTDVWIKPPGEADGSSGGGMGPNTDGSSGGGMGPSTDGSSGGGM